MLTERSPHVCVERVAIGRPSASSNTTDVTSVLLETWCAHELQWVVDEDNSPLVWQQIIRDLQGYLVSLWMSGALQGAKAEEALFITCDHSTMTQEDILHGHVICLIGLALITPGEFSLFRIQIRQKTRRSMGKPTKPACQLTSVS